MPTPNLLPSLDPPANQYAAVIKSLVSMVRARLRMLIANHGQSSPPEPALVSPVQMDNVS
jgi:hypothetical protein